MDKIEIKYRIAARTEAAGKYEPSAPQEGNEDNYGLIPDVSNPDTPADFDTILPLGKDGLLLFVADGMGGHNAGEVASKIAVDTVYAKFAPDSIPPKTSESHESRAQYLEEVVREADRNIRAHAKKHPDCEGMGSTLVIAWLVGNELTVTWCGDSRAYLYRPGSQPQIFMVSEDHSYVQELVQRNVIPYEATFGHPRGNIVTRCLGGGGKEACPESRMAHVGKGDIILLCSDGLSGVLFDDGRLFDGQPITEENICDIVTAHRESLRQCATELFAAAERNNWYDNVTAILCEIAEGPDAPVGIAPVLYDASGSKPLSEMDFSLPMRKRPVWLWIFLAAAVALVVGGVGGWLLWGRPVEEPAAVVDTTVEPTEEEESQPATSELAPKQRSTRQVKETASSPEPISETQEGKKPIKGLVPTNPQPANTEK